MTVQYGVFAAMLAGWLMVVAGIGKRQLEPRPRDVVPRMLRNRLLRRGLGRLSRRGGSRLNEGARRWQS
jgi:hypothetical protein